jgi:cytidine deaminase
MITADVRQKLIEEAKAGLKNAYAPYSNYPVSAALLASNGKIYKGVNVENASYSLTICAERSAIVSAVSEGVKDFKAIAIVTKNGGFPCGSCRQVLAEFGLEIEVTISDLDGTQQTMTVADLLPHSFGAEKLEITG